MLVTPSVRVTSHSLVPPVSSPMVMIWLSELASPPVYRLSVWPEAIFSVQMTAEEKEIGASSEQMICPFSSHRLRRVPACCVSLQVTIKTAWLSSGSTDCAIPAVPSAARVPPVMLASPS